MYEELDVPVSDEEILAAVKRLKRNKSTGIDNILNEYFIECADILLEPLKVLFNRILDNGVFPTNWSSGIIVPILKKQPSSNVNNYRGITLISCLGKLFTSIVNERMKKWSIKYDKLTDAQFGFKAGHSTMDAIFILHNIVNMYLSENKRVYAAFIDYSKCFDLINRQALWFKLIKEGIDGKLLKIVRAMYSNVKSCVRHMDTLSDFFKSDVGLFQGEITSPILFSLFVNDIEHHMQENMNNGLTLDQLSIFLIMFADDCALLSDSAQGLQSNLNQLDSYCKKWKLTVNTDKTKVMIFRKGGQLTGRETFTFNGNQIEVVENFNYLGFVMNSRGSFKKGIENLASKGLKSMCSLNNIIKDMCIPVNITFDLFDTYVASVLSYCCELWGFSNADNIERLHKKFLKQKLGVKMTTSNNALYGETGRLPLIISRKIRIIKYWFKLMKCYGNNCILYAMYVNMLQKCEKNASNWLSNIRDMLQQSGFNDVWVFRDSVVNINCFIAQFRLRLKDIYSTQWRGAVNTSTGLTLFRDIKSNIEISDYLTVLDNFKHRQAISKMRLSSHKLNIEKGRYTGVPRNDRKCELCNKNDIEDEYHFMIVCDVYNDLRREYIPSYYINRPSVYKFTLLLNVKNKKLLHKIALYIIKATKLRNSIINIVE